jgi:hypothetical protein
LFWRRSALRAIGYPPILKSSGIKPQGDSREGQKMSITPQKFVRKAAGRKALFMSAATLSGSGVPAQAVYRREANGQVSYSHASCTGATVVDTTPAQMLDKSRGVSRVGRDVWRERPGRSLHEAAARSADAQSREKAEAELFLSRNRFRNRRC